MAKLSGFWAAKFEQLEAERDRYRELLEQIVAPYRPMRADSMPNGVHAAIALLDAENQEDRGA